MSLPVLAIHGAGGSAAHWDDVVRALGAPAWLHVLDLPGRRGDGALPLDHVDAMLDAVLAKLDTLGITRAVWAGHSMGGVVSQCAATRSPARVAGLVLASTTPLFRIPEATFETIATQWETFLEGFARPLFAKNASDVSRRAATAVLRSVGPHTLAADLRTAMSWDGRDVLRTVDAPTLVVVGERDRLTPPDGARAIAEVVPDAELRLCAEAGHMLTYERPAELAEAILAVRARAR